MIGITTPPGTLNSENSCSLFFLNFRTASDTPKYTKRIVALESIANF